MYKSTKSSSSWSNNNNNSSSSSTSRRYSQPATTHSSSTASSRRGSEQAAAGRAMEVAPPPGPQYDDKLSVIEAKGARKGRSKDLSDLASFDREKFNPDGSLRTVHRVPEFSDQYNRVRGTRYLRHRVPQSYEIELTTQQIFSDESS